MRSNIRQLRKQKNISQKMLGDAIGLSQQVISRMECDRSKIQVDVLMNLADYFQVSTDCVLGYVGRRETKSPVELAIRMQAASDVETEAVIDRLGHMSREKKQRLWHALAALRQCL